MLVLADELVVGTVYYLSANAYRSEFVLSLIGVLEQLFVLLGEVALLCVTTSHLLVMQISLVDLDVILASATLVLVELSRCLVVDYSNSVLLLVMILILVCRTKAICCANNAHEQ